jgi:hypothetical protein
MLYQVRLKVTRKFDGNHIRDIRLLPDLSYRDVEVECKYAFEGRMNVIWTHIITFPAALLHFKQAMYTCT